jgi:hypothetical protein
VSADQYVENTLPEISDGLVTIGLIFCSMDCVGGKILELEQLGEQILSCLLALCEDENLRVLIVAEGLAKVFT